MNTKRVQKGVAIACPSPNGLQGYLLGRQPKQEMDLIHEHVKTCLSCQQTLVKFDTASDSLINRLRQAKGPAMAPIDSDGAAKLIAAAKVLTRSQGAPPPSVADAKAITRSQASPAPAAAAPYFTVHFPGYRILGQLGQGGCGTVYKVCNERMGGRIEALKTIKDPGDTHLRERFRQEILAVAQLEHPNIIRAYDTGIADGLLYFTMEFASGCDLAKLVHERGGPLPTAEACTLICQAAEGLQIAHDKNIVHRDIKPSNLILTEHGYVQVLDLGLARLVGQTDRASPLTGNAIIGTPIYMAPEQARDTHNVTAAVDIYSLGCTLYYLLTGHNPAAGRLRIDNADLQPILERMVDSDPSRRHPTARAVIDDLRHFRFMGPVSLETMKKRSPGGTSLLPQSTLGQAGQSTAGAPAKTALKPRLVAQPTAMAVRPATMAAAPVSVGNSSITMQSSVVGAEQRVAPVPQSFAQRNRFVLIFGGVMTFVLGFCLISILLIWSALFGGRHVPTNNAGLNDQKPKADKTVDSANQLVAKDGKTTAKPAIDPKEAVELKVRKILVGHALKTGDIRIEATFDSIELQNNRMRWNFTFLNNTGRDVTWYFGVGDNPAAHSYVVDQKNNVSTSLAQQAGHVSLVDAGSVTFWMEFQKPLPGANKLRAKIRGRSGEVVWDIPVDLPADGDQAKIAAANNDAPVVPVVKPNETPKPKAIDLTGRWEGKFLRNGQTQPYRLEMSITQVGSNITGSATVTEYENPLIGRKVTQFTGVINGDTFKFDETKFVENQANKWKSLIKGDLRAVTKGNIMTLSGPWQTIIASDNGGQIELTKK
jgi:serine/threonine protein kinase